MTFYYERVFPAIWFGFLILFIALPLVMGASRNAIPPLPFFIAPTIMIVVGYVVMKKLVFSLADEVWDDGDALVVRNRGENERIALSDVKNVNYSSLGNPPLVTLSLRRSTVFGDEIKFSGPIRFVPFWTSPVIKDLVDRIDLARRKN